MTKKQKTILPNTNKRIRTETIFYILLVTVITLAAFYPVIKCSFTNLDDDIMVETNIKIRNLSVKNITSFFTSYYWGLYHPFVLLSYSIEYKYFGLNPHAYHITNLILHLFNCLLVYWLIFLITNKTYIAFIVSILFGIHPLHVESVTWITERKDVLYTLFFLSSIISYIYYCKQKIEYETRNRIETHSVFFNKYYSISLILFLFSLMSKPMSVTFPFLLLLYDYYANNRITKSNLLEKLPFFVIAFIFTMITLSAQSPPGKIKLSHSTTLLDTILNPNFALLFYPIKMIFPFKLSCIYPSPTTIGPVFKLIYYISPAIVIGVAILVYQSLKKTNKILFGILFYFITILPVIQIISVGISVVSDRYTYVPLIGLFYLVGEGFSYITNKKNYTVYKNLLICLLVFIILSFSLLTHQRCKVWNNSLSLWNDVLKNYSYAPKVAATAYTSRAIVYLNKGDYETAISDCNNAIANDPTNIRAYTNRGIAYGNMGKYDRALEDFNTAIKLDPFYEKNYNNRGIVYARKGDYDTAIIDYTKAIELNPESIDAYYNRGIAYINKKEFDNAITDFNQVLKLDPYSVKAYNKRGNAYLQKGDYETAISDFNHALMIDPKFAESYNNRGNVYFLIKNYDNAISDYTRAIELDPKFVHAYYNRAIVYYTRKEYSKASQDFLIAQKLGYNINPKFLEPGK